MTNPDPHIAHELLSHQAFLRRLATGLVGEDAEDLVQDVWQRALERPPHHGRQLRAWLARVARNLAANRWRGDARRTVRETRGAIEQPAGDELEARLELQKELVGALDSLSPSSREAILLRYFEGLAPRDIARRQGVPVATVKTRLRRGLEQLRATLDKQYGGDRATWMSAITALGAPVGSGVATGTLVIGGIAVGTMIKVAGAVVVAAVCLYFATRTPPEEPRPSAEIELQATDSTRVVAAVSNEVEDLATDPVRRSAVPEEPTGGVSAIAGLHVLRLILSGTTEEYARRATVTVAGVKKRNEQVVKFQDPWPCQGVTSRFDLDPFLSALVGRGELHADQLVVEVDHPLHFSETVRVALSSGVKQDSGQTVYEVRAELSEVVYWPEFTLAVRDANTREHLDDVELRCAPTAFMGLVQQPGESGPFTVIGTGLTSPIAIRGGRKEGEPEELAAGMALVNTPGESLQLAELSQPEETGRGVMMYARRAGYAWSRVVLDISKGAKREILLGPDATLGVRVANVQSERYAELEKRATLFVRRIQPDGDEATVWSRDLDETLETEGTQIDGLEPGNYAVLVELSTSWQRKPTELGRETVFLGTGAARDVLLVVPDPPEPTPNATLGGVVSFPSFGGEEKVRLEFYRSDYRYGDADAELMLTEFKPVAAAAPTWSFSTDLPVGRYQARLMPFLKSWMIDLPGGGREDVELVIPELAEVLIETVDARTGDRIPLEGIAYRALEVVPGQVTHGGSGPWFPVEFDGDPGRFRFWTAPGALAVQTRGSADYGPFSEELDLVPGVQSMRLKLSPACTIRFEFRVDGAALPHEDGVFSGLSRCISAVGHDGRVGGMYPYSLVQASAPGIYEISFEGVGADRFLPIPPRRIEARAGQTTEVIVELRRK